ncbi:MAG: hypothetical protein ACYSOY_00470, partial [Planctomycetota bacterium]
KIDVVLKRCSQGSSGFVGGEAVEELVEMLLRLKDSLERGDCEYITVLVFCPSVKWDTWGS